MHIFIIAKNLFRAGRKTNRHLIDMFRSKVTSSGKIAHTGPWCSFKEDNEGLEFPPRFFDVDLCRSLLL